MDLGTALGLLVISGLFAAPLATATKSQHRSRLVLDGQNKHDLSARALPSGWSIYAGKGDGGGCFFDTSPRVLDGAVTSSWDMDVETCLAFCVDQGFNYAGVEYSYECYCGSNLINPLPAPSSDCSLGCGSGVGICGNAWRLNIYQYSGAAAPSTGDWTDGGCVKDGEARALTGFSQQDIWMTADKCTALCASKGFTIAGMEFGYQCFCGNSLANGLGHSIDSNHCNEECWGNANQQCGGTWALNIWNAATSANNAQWTYQGCVQDNPSRVLTYMWADYSMTMAGCLASCQVKGYTYGGVENGVECWCGAMPYGNVKTLGDSSCSSSCSGGGSQCGGPWALALWQYGTSGSSTTSPVTPHPAIPPGLPSGWSYQYCATDGASRALTGASWVDSSMTTAKCLNFCQTKSFALAGVELENGLGTQAANGGCTSVCAGDNTQNNCGGGWQLSLYSTLTGSALTSALNPQPTTTSSTASTSSATSTSSAVPTATQAPSSGSGGSYTPTLTIPGNNQNKYVWAHHIVGNTYNYGYSNWVSDIQLAQTGGIDGFVLNIGPDSWQPARVADAYQAAQDQGITMMISFDMTAFSCGDGTFIGLFQQYLQYLNHPAAAKYQGKSALTTFSGESCTFGQGSVNAGWQTILGGQRGSTYFMPNFNVDPTTFGNFNIDADVNWGSAWPVGGTDIDTSRDQWFMQNLNGKGYVGTVSPLFFTHLPWKNFVWRGDDWLFSQRWEQLIGMRPSIDQVEMLAWNDYGESIYMDNIGGDMPPQAQTYASSQFPHSDLLSLSAFYAVAWKTGSWPAITQDQIWVMARPHPAMANAYADPYGPPTGRELTQDNLYAQVHLTAPATVILCAGSSCSTQQGQAGINRFSQPLVVGSGISVQVSRNGQTTASVAPSFTFDGNPAQYNFNYIIKSSS